MVNKKRVTYEDFGVSTTKKDVYDAIKDIDPGIFPDSFCKVIPDILTGNPRWCLIAHADGAGTKAVLAYMYYKETGNIEVFQGIAQDSIVMNLDDIICTGAVDRFVLSNTIGRNKFKIGSEVISEIIFGYENFARKMSDYGIAIANAGGETADLGDLVQTIIVDSTLITIMCRNQVIRSKNISPGDIIIGLSSSGKSKYEEKSNSGIGSNGFTLARHVLLDSEYRSRFPETFDVNLDKSLAYHGPFHMSDFLPKLENTVGEALLSPTRTYAPILKEILSQYRDYISFVVHCTGGGQTKCLKFGSRICYIKDNLFPPPEIFRLIQEEGNIDWCEMYKSFNMGHRIEIIARPESSDPILEISKRFGVDARIIGRCKKSDKVNSVHISSEFGDFEYNEMKF